MVPKLFKKIPVTCDYGLMIHDQVLVFNEYDECSHQTIKMIDFQLKTSNGTVIPLHGVAVNFSIIFSRTDTTV